MLNITPALIQEIEQKLLLSDSLLNDVVQELDHVATDVALASIRQKIALKDCCVCGTWHFPEAISVDDQCPDCVGGQRHDAPPARNEYVTQF